MKGKIIATILGFLFVAMPTIVQAEEQIITTYREEYVINDESYLLWREENKPKTNVIIKTNDYSDLFVVSEEIDDITINYLWQHMDKMPKLLIEHLRKNGWEIYVQPTVYLNDIRVYGYTAFRERKIYIDTQLNDTLIHELGHVVHLDIMAKRDTSKWKTIIPSQVNNVYFHEGMNTEYICFKIEESFAQSFYEYVYYPWELEGSAPDIFQMYQNVCKLY